MLPWLEDATNAYVRISVLFCPNSRRPHWFAYFCHRPQPLQNNGIVHVLMSVALCLSTRRPHRTFNFCPILSQLETPAPLPYFCPILSELQANNVNDHACVSVLLKPRCKRRNTPAFEFLSYSVRTRGTGPQCCSSAVCCPGWKTPRPCTFEFLAYSVRTRGDRIGVRISVIGPNRCRIMVLSTF